MLNFIKRHDSKQEQEMVQTTYLLEELERIYKINENYGLNGNGYLEGDSEVEKMINKILELKNSQVRTQFLLNSELIEFVTQMDYVKEMVDRTSAQKLAAEEVAASSEEMSQAIEEIANYAQTSLNSTTEAISISTSSLETITEAFKYINKSFDDIHSVKTKMLNVVEGTKEIDTVVNIINDIAEQTNLLSLNASIEAARSGEAGKGFAVVAKEIKRLAESSKESANYIRDMVGKVRGDIEESGEAITEAVDGFSKGKEHINQAVTSMDKMEGSLQEIGSVFESISANVEEQSAATQQVTARLNEINDQTHLLSEVCMKTGQGIYNLSMLAENIRNTSLPYYKDFKGSQLLIPVAAEHLLWKWKAYNVVCGFAQLDENSIPDHTTCTLGQYIEKAKQSDPTAEIVKNMDEPHKKVHTLSREIIRAVNSGDQSNIDHYLKELDDATIDLVNELKVLKI